MRSERVLAIENPCRLSIDTARLKIEREGATSLIAIVDIGVLLIDTVQVELTAGVIRELTQADIAIIVTDAKHYPSALLMPSAAHTHTVKRQRLQAVLEQAFCDKLWSTTIAAKLRNQAKFLSAQGESSALARLERMASTIQAGDPENYEAQGAKLYWREVFKGKFKREKQGAEDVRNAALNFGYAILRGLFARYISVSGLSPVFGFGHSNFENPYCLIDDLIEPYRPCVDALVATMVNDASSFDGANKRIVLKLLDCEALFASQDQIKKYRMHTAIYETVTTYTRALEGKREHLLEYPIGFVLPLG